MNAREMAVEDQLNEEERHADHMVEVLRMLASSIDQPRMDEIVIPITQITLGQVVAGALALHEQRRKDAE